MGPQEHGTPAELDPVGHVTNSASEGEIAGNAFAFHHPHAGPAERDLFSTTGEAERDPVARSGSHLYFVGNMFTILECNPAKFNLAEFNSDMIIFLRHAKVCLRLSQPSNAL